MPYGSVATYGDIATLLGSPRVARHVGFALAALNEEDVPWHRIINAKGTISGRGDTIRAELQRRLLEAEGLIFDEKGRVELKRFRWMPSPTAIESISSMPTDRSPLRSEHAEHSDNAPANRG